METGEKLSRPTTPMYLSFGSHGPDDISYLQPLLERGEEYLHANPDGYMTFFIENASCPAIVSEKIFTITAEQSILPDVAFFYITFVHFFNKIPSQNDFNEFIHWYIDQEPFLMEELRICDQLSIKHPGRIRILSEAREDSPEETQRWMDAMQKHTQHFRESERLLKEGSFTQALPHFQHSVTIMAEFSEHREQSITMQLKNAVEKPDCMALIARLGASHTSVYHNLRREGYHIQRGFDSYDKVGRYWQGPYSTLIRLLQCNPHQSVSELTWYQGFIGTTLSDVLAELVATGPIQKHEEGDIIAQTTGNILRDCFPSMETVQAFEESVRTNGFEAACRILLFEWTQEKP